MRSLALFSVVCLFILGVSAWPWRPYGLKLAPSLDRRADTTAADSASTAASPSTEATASSTAATGTATGTDTASETATGTGTGTGTATGSATGSGTGTGSGSGTKTTTQVTSVDPRLPPGGIEMITPASTATTYYKIGQDVTFVWNYTSLSVTPSAINVVASCSLNDETYTISSNMSVKETGSVVWDTGKYQSSATVPLLTATYTLIVYDADESPGYIAPAGHLSSDNQLQFGMYVPQKYTPLGEYKCATCNSALSEMDRHAFKFALVMMGVTVASFTWFSGLGAFSA